MPGADWGLVHRQGQGNPQCTEMVQSYTFHALATGTQWPVMAGDRGDKPSKQPEHHLDGAQRSCRNLTKAPIRAPFLLPDQPPTASWLPRRAMRQSAEWTSFLYRWPRCWLDSSIRSSAAAAWFWYRPCLPSTPPRRPPPFSASTKAPQSGARASPPGNTSVA